MPSPPSSETPNLPVSLPLLRVAWMADPATMAHHLTRGRFRIPPHIDLLSREVARAVREGGRLLVQMPPRHGKSETVSVWTPVWALNARPNSRIMLATYETDFASGFGRRARNLMEEHEKELLTRLAQDSSAAYRWDTPEGGGMIALGAGGALTGRGADLLIIDDPHKNAEEAYSKAVRDRVWEWYTTSAFTRLEPGAAVVLIQTRWHEEDLAGRILAQEGDLWRVLRLPALAEEGDLLGRRPGAALWPERYDEEALAKIRLSIGERAFEGLYQQQPFGDGGTFFKREWIERRYEEPAPGLYRLPGGQSVARGALHLFATVDLAVSTRTTADFTVIAVFGTTPDGTKLLLEIDRARREGPDIVPAIERAVERWGLPVVWVESNGFQLAIVQEARRRGIPVRELQADRDKVARAIPASAALEGGRLLLPRFAPWLEAFEAELLSFPGGAHDDQVDALSWGVAARGGSGWSQPLAAAAQPQEDDDERSRGGTPVFGGYPFGGVPSADPMFRSRELRLGGFGALFGRD